jgi:hypothetical protein
MIKTYLLEIYKVEAEKYNKTREIHWKMNISLWTVLIVAIYAKGQNQFTFSKLPICVEVLIYFLFLVIHFVFIFKIHGSLNRSLARMSDMATCLLKEKEEIEIKWTDLGKNAPQANNYWEFLQLGITLFLIGIFYLIR